MTSSEHSNSATFAKLEDRVIQAERELRAIRGALAAATRCTCPVGFGSAPNPQCPKHGSR